VTRRQLFIRLLAASAALIVAIALPGVSPSVSAQSQASKSLQGEGLSSLGACLSKNPHLLVALVVDESGSLRETDRDALRVPALRAALGAFASLTRGGAATKPISVDVLITGFSADYRVDSQWTSLNSDSLNGLLNQTDPFRDRNQGNQTDYVLAIDGVANSLAQRAAELGAAGVPTCKTMVLFTDGEYAIDNAVPGSKPYAQGVTDPTEATELGIRRLCAPDGLADQLRRSGVVNISVGLGGKSSSSSDPFILLREIAIGPACGSFADPASLGVLLSVTDVNLLTTAMIEAITGTPGRALDPGTVCGGLPCDRTVTIDIPDGVGSFYLLTRTEAPGIERWVRTPDSDTPVLLKPGGGAIEIGSSDAEPIQLSETTVMVDVGLDDNSPAVGTWEVSFVSTDGSGVGAVADAEVFLFGALAPTLSDDSRFTAGEPTTLEVRVVDGSGAVVGGEVAAATQLAVTVADPSTGALTRPEVTGPDADGVFRFDYLADSESKAAAINVTMALSVVVEGGLVLRPVVVEKAVRVEVPVVVPNLADTELRLAVVEGEALATGTLRVTGPERGEGQACLTTWTSKALPEGVTDAQLASNSDCVTVSAGSTVDIPVSVDPQGVGSGTASGLVEVRLAAADGSEEVIRTVPASFEMLKAVNAPVRWAAALLLTLLGVGIPLGIFWLISRAQTTFMDLENTQWAEIPVVLDAGTVRQVGADGADLTPDLTLDDLKYVRSGQTRSIDVGRGDAISVDVLHRPFGTSAATITAGAPSLGSSGFHRRLFGGRRSAQMGLVPLELVRSWGFVADDVQFPEAVSGQSESPDPPAGTVTHGRLVVFIDDGHDFLNRARSVLRDATTALPGAVVPLVEAQWATRQATDPATDPSQLVGAGIGAQPSGEDAVFTKVWPDEGGGIASGADVPPRESPGSNPDPPW